MKLLTSLLLLTLTAACHAEKSRTPTCSLRIENLNFVTPTSDNIESTFWQKDVDGYESINRLHIAYKDGSVAVVEHKYCLMYNFEIAYYASTTNELSDGKKLSEILKSFFNYSAVQDTSIQNAVSAIIKRFEEKGFDADSALATAHDDSTQDNKRAEYSVSYMPIEDSSLHRAALFIYMGIGGEH